MAKVGIVMGSDSDLKVMSKAADMLEELGIEYHLGASSAGCSYRVGKRCRGT